MKIKNSLRLRKSYKKKTRQGQSTRTIYGRPGPHGGNKRYKKKYRGQGKS